MMEEGRGMTEEVNRRDRGRGPEQGASPLLFPPVCRQIATSTDGHQRSLRYSGDSNRGDQCSR